MAPRKGVPKKEKAANPVTEFLKAINVSKENILTEDNEKTYQPFLMNRCLSRHESSVLYAQEMNQRAWLDKRMHFDFLRFALRRQSRFSARIDKEQDDNLELIQKYFGYPRKRAFEVLELFSKEDLELIAKSLDTGGLSKGEKAK